jgi:hypothetical protein
MHGRLCSATKMTEKGPRLHFGTWQTGGPPAHQPFGLRTFLTVWHPAALPCLGLNAR